MPGGQDGQVGFKTESVVGTAVTVDKFLPFVSERVVNNLQVLESQTLSARHTTRVLRRGGGNIEGPIRTELANTTLAILLKHMFGTVGTTGAGPFVHTYSPSGLTGDSMTVQIGRPATSGTVHPFTYAGCKVASWTIAANVDEIATLELNIIGMSETTATALATASFDAAWSPFIFSEVSLTVGGGARADCRSVTLSGNNNLPGRRRLGSVASREPLQTGRRDYTGTISADFVDLTDYNLYVAGTQSALVLTFTNGTQSLVFTMNIMYTGETPGVDGPELLEQPLPFRCISGTSDAAAITAVLTNSETSAA